MSDRTSHTRSQTLNRRSPRRRISTRLRLGLVACLAITGALSQGCGTDSANPFSSFESGATIDVQGIISLPATQQGDFEPRKMIAELKAASNEVSVTAAIGKVLPDAKLEFTASDPERFQIEIPPGISMARAAALIQPTGLLKQISPALREGTSRNTVLRSADTQDMVHLSPALATLVAEDQSSLEQYNRSWIVKIRAKTRTEDGSYGSGDLIQVLSVEKVEPLSIAMKGEIALIGEEKDCLGLNRDDGTFVELVGSGSLVMHQREGSGRRVRIEATDLGLSTSSCSGGPQVMVTDYNAL